MPIFAEELKSRAKPELHVDSVNKEISSDVDKQINMFIGYKQKPHFAPLSKTTLSPPHGPYDLAPFCSILRVHLLSRPFVPSGCASPSFP